MRLAWEILSVGVRRSGPVSDAEALVRCQANQSVSDQLWPTWSGCRPLGLLGQDRPLFRMSVASDATG